MPYFRPRIARIRDNEAPPQTRFGPGFQSLDFRDPKLLTFGSVPNLASLTKPRSLYREQAAETVGLRIILQLEGMFFFFLHIYLKKNMFAKVVKTYVKTETFSRCFPHFFFRVKKTDQDQEVAKESMLRTNPKPKR